jgi:carboxymethylenebutenolidase
MWIHRTDCIGCSIQCWKIDAESESEASRIAAGAYLFEIFSALGAFPMSHLRVRSVLSLSVVLALTTGVYASPPGSPPPDAPASPAASSKPAGAAKVYGQPISTAINAGKMITYKSGNREIEAYLVTPKIPADTKLADAPAVVLVHDIFGMTPFIKSMAETLAKQGYTVIVPNLYSRYDVESKALEPQEAARDYAKLSDVQATRDLSAAIDYLEGPPVEGMPAERRVAVVGHDMGGIYAMMLAGSDIRVTCAVNYYGRILYSATSPNRPASPVESLFNLRAPLLSFYGTIDPQVPDEQIDAMESRLSKNLNKTFYEIVRYRNVGHSFLVPTRRGYNAEAAGKAEARTREFLARYLRAEPVKVE